MILIINICGHEMHYYEFVKPIEDILKADEEPFITRHYTGLTLDDLRESHRIIITGTSLQDFEYSKNIDKFKFLAGEKFDKPILGICGGMQILCVFFGCKLVKGKEIGLVKAVFSSEFLGANGERDIYSLHNMFVKDDDTLKKYFNIYASTHEKAKTDKGCVQAIKHKHKKIYGALFHPEVRNKDMIVKFLSV